MADIGTILSQRDTAGPAASGARPQDLGRDAFLRLLVTQLQQQSPLDPVNNEAFVAQLAQFSALEQAEATNAGVTALVESQRLSQAADLVGRRITYIDPATGERVPGTVSAASVEAGQVVLDIGGGRVALDRVIQVQA